MEHEDKKFVKLDGLFEHEELWGVGRKDPRSKPDAME